MDPCFQKLHSRALHFLVSGGWGWVIHPGGWPPYCVTGMDLFLGLRDFQACVRKSTVFFPTAFATNHYKVSYLKQHKSLPLPFWRLETWKLMLGSNKATRTAVFLLDALGRTGCIPCKVRGSESLLPLLLFCLTLTLRLPLMKTLVIILGLSA